jgi:hypothetical protein
LPPEKHQPGLVVHGLGWPLKESNSSGGAFLYHAEDNQVYMGLITDLNYSNPHVSPFEEFQRWKHHPETLKYLEGGSRVSYGARAIAKGGMQFAAADAVPRRYLIGCDAGTLNAVKIKGNHTAMKSGMIAAEAVVEALPVTMPRRNWTALRKNCLASPGSTTSCTAPAISRAGCTSSALCSALPWSGSTRISVRRQDAVHAARQQGRLRHSQAGGRVSEDRLPESPTT